MKTDLQNHDVNDLTNRYTSVDGNANGGSGEAMYYYYNDQWQVLAEYTSYDTWKAYNVFGNYIDETLLRGKYGISPYVYAHDHLYSTVAAVNINAVDETSIFERYEYDAYGKTRILSPNYELRTTSSYGNPYTFTGRRLDVLDSGDYEIMYYRNRYYHPELGRFMTHDPLGINPEWMDFEGMLIFPFSEMKYDLTYEFSADIFLSESDDLLNIYAKPFNPYNQYVDGVSVYFYAKGNPIYHIDPHGNCSLAKCMQSVKTLCICLDSGVFNLDKIARKYTGKKGAKQLVKILEKWGGKIVSGGKGSHIKIKMPGGAVLTVPVDPAVGTVKAILKKAMGCLGS